VYVHMGRLASKLGACVFFSTMTRRVWLAGPQASTPCPPCEPCWPSASRWGEPSLDLSSVPSSLQLAPACFRAHAVPSTGSVALACKGPLNARLATGVGLSFFLSLNRRRPSLRPHGAATLTPTPRLPCAAQAELCYDEQTYYRSLMVCCARRAGQWLPS
jgi:hypothetical protein